MRIAVIGAGALGLYYGAMLQRSGHEVRFLLRRDFEAIQNGGLQVTSPNGNFHLPQVQGFRSTTEMGEVDLVIIGLKTFANHALIDLVRPLAEQGAAFLTLQNGLGNEELLAEAFGAKQVLGGVAFLCSNRGEPGYVHHLGQGAIRLGEFSGGLSERAIALAEMFRTAGVGCEAVGDLRKARWEKLVWNIPFNGLCALTGKTTTDILQHSPSRQEAIALMREVIAGGNAQGLQDDINVEAFIQRMLELTESMDHYRPSMMIDREEQRPLELDSIYAIPLQQAAARGVEMTKVRLLHALLDIGERPARSN